MKPCIDLVESQSPAARWAAMNESLPSNGAVSRADVGGATDCRTNAAPHPRGPAPSPLQVGMGVPPVSHPRHHRPRDPLCEFIVAARSVTAQLQQLAARIHVDKHHLADGVIDCEISVVLAAADDLRRTLRYYVHADCFPRGTCGTGIPPVVNPVPCGTGVPPVVNPVPCGTGVPPVVNLSPAESDLLAELAACEGAFLESDELTTAKRLAARGLIRIGRGNWCSVTDPRPFIRPEAFG